MDNEEENLEESEDDEEEESEKQYLRNLSDDGKFYFYKIFHRKFCFREVSFIIL